MDIFRKRPKTDDGDRRHEDDEAPGADQDAPETPESLEGGPDHATEPEATEPEATEPEVMEGRAEPTEGPDTAAHPNDPDAGPELFHRPNAHAEHDGDREGPRTDFADEDEDGPEMPKWGEGGEEDDKVARESAIKVPDYDFELPHDATATPEDHGAETDAVVDDGSEDAMEDAPFAAAAQGVTPDEEGEETKKRRMGLRFGDQPKAEGGGWLKKLGPLGEKLERLRGKAEEGDTDVEGVAVAAEVEEAAPEEPAKAHELEHIEPGERYKEVETYPIHPPYAYVRIMFDDENKDYVYQVLEPELTDTEREILDFIEETLVDMLTVSPEDIEGTTEVDFITDRFNDVIFDYSIILHEDEEQEDAIKRKLLYYIHRDFIGHGPMDVLMEDPYIEDISCDGPIVPIFLYHRKYESMRSTVIFGNHHQLDSYVIKMAQRSGKHISIAEPILDATMGDGSRLQATLGKEVSAGGSTYTIRKFRPDPFTPPDLVLFRTMSAEMLSYLWIAVQHGASIMYSGGTASGKTTSLNAILLFIPPQMKIVSIEDTREVNLPHENWIAGITRTGFGPRDRNGRQAGEIDMFQLLKNALRQRPEYIIVGEVRGQEAYSLFQAMATGHAAYGTMHADSVDAVIHRLESDPINVPRTLLEALDVVSVQIQTRVGGKRVRRTKQISEIVGIDPHTREILTNEVFRWVPKDDSFKFSGVSYVLERIQIEKGLPQGSMVKELKRRAEIIRWMIDQRVQNYKEVSKLVSGYYREPEVVMKLVRDELIPEEVPPGLREIAARQMPELAAELAAEAEEEEAAPADEGDETEAGTTESALPEDVAGGLSDALASAALEHAEAGTDAGMTPSEKDDEASMDSDGPTDDDDGADPRPHDAHPNAAAAEEALPDDGGQASDALSDGAEDEAGDDKTGDDGTGDDKTGKAEPHEGAEASAGDDEQRRIEAAIDALKIPDDEAKTAFEAATDEAAEETTEALRETRKKLDEARRRDDKEDRDDKEASSVRAADEDGGDR